VSLDRADSQPAGPGGAGAAAALCSCAPGSCLRMDGSAAEQCALEAWVRPPLIPWQQLRQLEAAQREIEALRCEVAPTDEHGASSRIQHAAASLARVQTVEPKLPCALR
jgi:hypothetical protein